MNRTRVFSFRFDFARALVLSFVFLPVVAVAQSPSPSPSPIDQAPPPTSVRDPIQNSDEFKSKMTFGVYFTKDAQAYDLNIRHQFGPSVTAWIAGYADSKRSELIRVGAQYDYHKKWFHFVPTGEIETTKGASLSLYSELGHDTFAIIGYSRTNLKTFFDLFWDPGDAMQLGVAHKISSYDRIQAYTIFDVRLHTAQENTHVLYRHKLNRNNGVTFDAVFKSGRIDSGKFIHTAGIGAYYDRPKWFWKLYLDPHVNFTDHTMVRTGIGFKF